MAASLRVSCTLLAAFSVSACASQRGAAPETSFKAPSPANLSMPEWKTTYSTSAIRTPKFSSENFLVSGASVSPPYGYVDFCRRYGSECVNNPRDSAFEAMTREKWILLDNVNLGVNRKYKALTDQKIYGVKEFWNFPKVYADCEDYVLQKKKELESIGGFSSRALLITVVRDERGEGHAVLTVRTLKGDFILDNKVNEIVAWKDKKEYKPIIIQSQDNPKIWRRIGPNLGSFVTTGTIRISFRPG